MKNIILALFLSALMILSACTTLIEIPPSGEDGSATDIIKRVVKQEKPIPKFDSCTDLVDSFKDASISRRGFVGSLMKTAVSDVSMMAESASAAGSDVAYSETNIQVEGVDEADIVKTDGKYIYTLSGSNLVIARAYPAEKAEILSTTNLGDLEPRELFIDNGKLLVFGQKRINVGDPIPVVEPEESGLAKPLFPRTAYYPNYVYGTGVDLYDISNKEEPELVRSVDFEGGYKTSRKIDSDVYFVVNSYPRYYQGGLEDDIVPRFRDMNEDEIKYLAKDKEFKQSIRCAEVGYLEPINPRSFVTIASISMSDEDADINKKVVVGSGENVYASLENLFIAETSYDYSIIREVTDVATKGVIPRNIETTVVHKFALDNGNILYQSSGEVPGRVLNQFSMDEFENNFRIATTIGRVSRSGGGSTNNIYVLDEDLEVIGSLEDLAPGESIYSARFMGERAYLVTFQKIDPLFVIDLSNPSNPKVLGKLKIPGYSDYLHPYDDNHIIGVGKEAVEAEQGNFAWYQGMKMAIFDVSDVENPVEMHKVLIGDRGTESEILRDHKAFLFDKEKELLVIPVTLAKLSDKIKEEYQPFARGDFVFQGAYVFNINLDNGFELRGTISHYEDDDIYKKSGYRFYGGNYNVRRSLYIDDILYTISNGKIQLNSLIDLDKIKELNIRVSERRIYASGDV